MLSFFQNKKNILISLCGLTLLCTGWTAGSSYGYRAGYALAQNQQDQLHITKEKVKDFDSVKHLLPTVQKVRELLIIKYKGEITRDFVTLLSNHLKGSALLCDQYRHHKDKDEEITSFCDTLIQDITDNRNALYTHLQKRGLK